MVTTSDTLRYKYLAYLTLRDAIAFYFGIPKFLADFNEEEVIELKLAAKLKKRPDLDTKGIEKYKRLVAKSIQTRVEFLEQDFRHCEDVLFTDNVWLQLLDINPEFFKVYLNKLSDSAVDELAVVPNWTIRDDSLKRPYLNSDLQHF